MIVVMVDKTVNVKGRFVMKCELRPLAWKSDVLKTNKAPNIHAYFPLYHIKGTLLPPVALNIGTGRKSLVAQELSNTDVIPRDTHPADYEATLKKARFILRLVLVHSGIKIQ